MREEKQNRKGLWTEEEDRILSEYVRVHGRGHWNRIPKLTGLKRCGKSCRMRWLNYLSPNVKHGDFSEEEEDLVVRLHKLLGNRWSLIAGRMPGRTDNQVKNFWNTRLRKKLGIEKTKVEATRSRSSKMHSSGLAEETQRILSPENFDFERLQSSEVTVAGNPPNAVEMRNEELQFGSVEFGNSDGFDMDGREFLEFYDGYPFDEIWQN
ncbi:hypothetical protein SLEP1_g32694 [Rubroshorea leprosula]|uniref:Uncharacterized protein n=1 Tax=Rubroshorea leprosula TaxID=152421 RepID=A0AAV5KE53_9ROSI|nr:hypothetical protein SLEP1_g32694 [Rubroshorea leprosula]